MRAGQNHSCRHSSRCNGKGKREGARKTHVDTARERRKIFGGSEGGEGEAQIDVSLRKEGRSAVIEVRNRTEDEQTNETLSHVFERFYRADASRNSQTGGHGIGLSMAQAIVSAHGGRISARTSDGRDFIVTAALPMV